ncbi:MAG TPA: DUF364 domain-containing protein [Clostridia bacterium]|nr:DUF364 domain-containing protein [Clostridia bacterium]
MKRPNPLIEAYDYIKNTYETEAMVPGNLEKIIFSSKWSGVFAERDQIGMAFNFTGDHSVYGPVGDISSIENLKQFVGKSLYSLVEYILPLDTDIHIRSICLSALNALSRPLILRGYSKVNAIAEFNGSGELDFILPEDMVVIIGYGGLINRTCEKCRELHIMDMRPAYMLASMCIGRDITYGNKKFFIHPDEENEEILSKADVVLMTGSTLVNGTFLDLIKYSKKARVIGMYGPSAQLFPDILIECGINYITSNVITSPDTLELILMDNFSTKDMFNQCINRYTVGR